jgi:AcrR family transcriptional regulator
MPDPVERILRAADRLFPAQGIQAVGVEALAAEAGVSKRTLYKHFGSKDSLIVAYLQRRAARLLPSEGPPLQQLLGVFDALARAFGQPGFRGCPFANAAAELGGTGEHPALLVVRDFKLARRRWFERQLRALGVADAGMLAYQMVLLVDGAIAHSMIQGGDPQAAFAARAAAQRLLDAAGVTSGG